MNASLLQDFRAMQLAVKGALAMKGVTDVKELLIEGTDSIPIGDNALIDTILLDKDVVIKPNREISGAETYPLYIGKGITV